MSMIERACEYLNRTDISRDADYEGYRIRGLLAEFADQEVELELSNMKNEKNNLSDQKASHRRTQRNLVKAMALLKTLLKKDDFIKLLQEANND